MKEVVSPYYAAYDAGIEGHVVQPPIMENRKEPNVGQVQTKPVYQAIKQEQAHSKVSSKARRGAPNPPPGAPTGPRGMKRKRTADESVSNEQVVLKAIRTPKFGDKLRKRRNSSTSAPVAVDHVAKSRPASLASTTTTHRHIKDRPPPTSNAESENKKSKEDSISPKSLHKLLQMFFERGSIKTLQVTISQEATCDLISKVLPLLRRGTDPIGEDKRKKTFHRLLHSFIRQGAKGHLRLDIERRSSNLLLEAIEAMKDGGLEFME